MRCPFARLRARTACLWLGATGFVACVGPEHGPGAPDGILLAPRGGGGNLSVTAADPAWGQQGETNKIVTIAGSGFAPGAQASWKRNGVTDPKVTVHSTQYVSSTQLVSTITIAPDATIDFYDITVMQSSRKGGIGTESATGDDLFEVTQATALAGTTMAREANENGQITGQGPGGAFFWSAATGMEALASSGIGMDLSEDGLTVVGSLGTEDPATKVAVVWTRSGTGWSQTVLPRDPATEHSNARAVASDPVTGAAIVIGGVDLYVPKQRKSTKQFASWGPRLWMKSSGAWQRIVLPSPNTPNQSIGVEDVSAGLVAVGNAGSYAVVWEPDGTGGWTALLIGPFLSDLKAINGAGSLTVGRNANFAAYWSRVGGAWTGPFMLPGGCSYAVDVDDLGRILMTGCPVPQAPNSRSSAAVIVAPYGLSDVTLLGGFGDQTTGPAVQGISRLGTWIVGSSTIKNAAIGAYWKVF